MKVYRVILVVVAAVFLAGFSEAVLVASDGFRATGAIGDYTDGTLGAKGDVTPAGTAGFGTDNVDATSWANATGDINVYSSMSLTHSGVTGSAQVGSIGIRSYNGNKNSNRALLSAPTFVASYYLSGLVQANTVGINAGRVAYTPAGNQQRCMGFMDTIATSSFDITTSGFFLGINATDGAVNLAVFAGGTAYNLFDITGNYDEAFQIVAKLDVDASGNETLTAWYAADGATVLTKGLSATVVGDIWQDAGDLDTFVAQTKITSQLDDNEPFDEMRFGTALGDVTTIPEPASVGLIASEGFRNTGDAGDYTDGTLGLQGDVTPAGTVGFGTDGVDATSWAGNTGDVNVYGSMSLTHSGVTGTAQDGSVGIRSYNSDKNSARSLGAPALASSYYLSGLVQANTVGINASRSAYTPAGNQQRCIGVMDTIDMNTFDITTSGFFLGINAAGDAVNLAVFANGTAYNLFDITEHYDEAFQIVAKLDVDASGNETLTAWYAENGATELTLALDAQDVGDIWQDVGGLDTFVVQTKATLQLNDYEPFDEIRFGATLFDVTTLPEPGMAGYPTWAAQNGLTAGVNDDLLDDAEAGGGDGINNLLEYALGGDPLANDAADILPVSAVMQADGINWFYYVQNRRTDDPSLAYTVLLGTDLVLDPPSVTNEPIGWSAEVDGFATYTNRTDVDNMEFFRLQVQKD